jgi:hypothetical protein
MRQRQDGPNFVAGLTIQIVGRMVKYIFEDVLPTRKMKKRTGTVVSNEQVPP